MAKDDVILPEINLVGLSALRIKRLQGPLL